MDITYNKQEAKLRLCVYVKSYTRLLLQIAKAFGLHFQVSIWLFHYSGITVAQQPTIYTWFLFTIRY